MIPAVFSTEIYQNHWLNPRIFDSNSRNTEVCTEKTGWTTRIPLRLLPPCRRKVDLLHVTCWHFLCCHINKTSGCSENHHALLRHITLRSRDIMVIAIQRLSSPPRPLVFRISELSVPYRKVQVARLKDVEHFLFTHTAIAYWIRKPRIWITWWELSDPT